MIPPEGQSTELKESLNLGREIAIACAAFASAQGGRIYVGVRDDGTVAGVTLGKRSLEDLANAIAQNTTPKIVPAITTTQEDGKTIVVIEVRENPTKPVSAYGRAYRRSGRTNQVLSTGEVADLYYATRGVTWDQTPRPDATLADVDPQKVRLFLARAKSERQWAVNPDIPLPEALKKLNLLQNGRPTVAALLLFASNPQQFLSQAKVRCARFKGTTEVEFLDMKVLEGDIIAQVEDALAFVRRNTSMAAKIEGLPERKEHWDYPLDALREAVINASCHRDYASPGNIQIRIFDDRLEVWNPGELPEGLTVEDLRQAHESMPRNKLLADAFFLIRFIEQFGTGTGRMITQCRAAGSPEPEFESRAGVFRIVFYRPLSVEDLSRDLNLNERQSKGIRAALQHGHITRKEYEGLTAAPTATAKRDLAELVGKKILAKLGRGRSISYALSAQMTSRNVSRKPPAKSG